MSTSAVMLMGFGGPDSLDAVEPFMCNLMGREPSEELLGRVRRRYLCIGGSSPLTGIAAELAAAVESELGGLGKTAPVRVGMRYWKPYIADTMGSLYSEGVRRIVAVSLSPFESKISHGAYREAISEAQERMPDLEVVEAPPLYELDDYVQFHAIACSAALQELDFPKKSVIVFTAHSLPLSDLVEDDPYVRGIRETADRVAGAIALGPGAEFEDELQLPGIAAYGNLTGERPWVVSYQSKGNRPGGWLEPDIGEVIAAASRAAMEAVIVVPIGFATDHMETLYDLDVVAAQQALDAGMEFARSVTPNAHEMLAHGIATSVAELL